MEAFRRLPAEGSGSNLIRADPRSPEGSDCDAIDVWTTRHPDEAKVRG
jgi:hypothetical protein